MTTYNRAHFVDEAIQSVLRQRTTFPFELVVGEDCSTDGTRGIVQKYAAQDPRVRLLLHPANLGMNPNFGETLRASRGEYIAILDSDDYWLDDEKLQLAVDFLDQNPDCAMCFHRALLVDETGTAITHEPVIREVKQKYTRFDLLGRVFRPRTCTVVFRRAFAPELPTWIYDLGLNIYDLPLYASLAQHGMIGFVDRTMGAYRIHQGGLWSQGHKPVPWKEQSIGERHGTIRRLAEVLHVYETMGRNLPVDNQPVIRRKIYEHAVWLLHLASSLEDWRSARQYARKAVTARPDLPETNRRLFVRLAMTSLFPRLRKTIRKLI